MGAQRYTELPKNDSVSVGADGFTGQYVPFPPDYGLLFHSHQRPLRNTGPELETAPVADIAKWPFWSFNFNKSLRRR